MTNPKSLISRVKAKAVSSAKHVLKNDVQPAAKLMPSSEARHYRMALMGSFAAQPGNGLVISVLRRAKVLQERGNQVDIMAFPFDTRFRHAAHNVSKSYSLGTSITLRNPYAELAGDDYRQERETVEPLPRGEDWNIVNDPANAKMRRAYRAGTYEQFIFSDEKTRIVFIDFLGEGGKRFKRAWYDETGLVTKFEYFSQDNKLVSVEYIHVDGTVFLRADVDTAGNEHGFVMSLPDGRKGSFANVSELEAWWLVNFVLDADKWNPIVSEYGFRANVFGQAAQERKLSVAYALHNLHLTAPYSYGSPIKEELAPFFEHLAE